MEVKLYIKNNYLRVFKLSSQMEKPRTFVSLMRDHTVTPDQFFNVPAITQQVKNNLNRFVNYCRSHQPFTQRMITLALNISYQQLETPNTKNASFAINDILSNEQPEIVELFFQIDNKTLSQPADIPEEIEGNIQSEAERLFSFDEDQQRQQQRPIQLKQYEVVTLSFQILKNPQRNETCLGHLQKIYSYLIRHNPLLVLGFINEHQELLKLLLDNLRYSSVSSLVAQLLTSQDKTNQYTYQNLKKQIIQQIINQLFASIEDEVYFDGVMILIEELINTTKQSYYEYFDDFKRISKLLISKDIMKRFCDILLLKNEKSFRNVSKFLQYLFQRINIQENENNYYNKTEEQDNTNHFEVEVFYEHLPTLIDLILDAQHFNSLTKISYLNFLYYMFTINKLKSFPFQIEQPSFLSLIDCFNRQTSTGIFKNKLYQLIVTILNKANNTQIKSLLDNNPQFYDNYFKSIKAANYPNTKSYNKNQTSGYDISIIHQLSKKNQNVLANATKVIGKDFKRICKKYQTKIATFQNNTNFVVEQEVTFEKFNLKSLLNNNENQNKSGQTPLSTGFSLNFVGKNNISIPILNIPDKSIKDFQDEKEDHRKQPKGYESQKHSNIRQVFQIEEVQNLTAKIQSLNLKDDSLHKAPQNDRTQTSQIAKPVENLQLLLFTPQKGVQSTQLVQRIQVVKAQPAIKDDKPKQMAKEQKGEILKMVQQKPQQKQRIRFYSRHLIIFV